MAKKLISLRIPEADLNLIRDYCKDHDISLTGFLISSSLKYIKEEEIRSQDTSHIKPKEEGQSGRRKKGRKKRRGKYIPKLQDPTTDQEMLELQNKVFDFLKQ